MWRRLLTFLWSWFKAPAVKLLPHKKEPVSLAGLTAAVFVRQSNGSRTSFELFLEQCLLRLGARVVPAMQEVGMALLKHGDFAPLHPDANICMLGTLVVQNGFVQQSFKHTEPKAEFLRRKAKWQARHLEWENKMHFWALGTRIGLVPVEPVLKPRIGLMADELYTKYGFSFRMFGQDGSILVSGTCEDFIRTGEASEALLRQLAEQAVEQVDESVWQHVII